MKFTIKRIKAYPHEDIRWDEGVYLGMSMNNTMFRFDNTIAEMICEITKHTSSYSVLVGDCLHRYNEQIFEGRNETEAIDMALYKGKILIDYYKIIADKYPAKYNFIFSGEMIKQPGFPLKFKRLKDIYDSHKEFKRLMDYTVKVFLTRQREIKVSEEDARRLCLDYLIEELAIFEMLAEKGLKVNVYPGNQLPIIKDIVTGKLKDVSKVLEKIQAIEIRFRPQN